MYYKTYYKNININIKNNIIQHNKNITFIPIKMGELRFINLIKPLMPLIHYITKPQKEIKLQKILSNNPLYLLICSQILLYCIYKTEGTKPIYWMREILDSSKGTLMGLGNTPLITSSMFMQVLTGTKIIDVGQSVKADREI